MKLAATFFILITYAMPSLGQLQEDSAFFKLPELEKLIFMAYEHSPLLKEKQKQSEINNKELQIEKRSWMDYLFIEGAVNYGLYDRLMVQNHSNDVIANSGVLSKSEQTGYYSRVGLKLPVSALSNRSRKLKQKRLEIEKANFNLEGAQKQIKHLIIESYFRLNYLNESMHAYFDIYQTLEISYIKSKKDLLNGRSDLNEFALLASTVGKAKNDYFKARSEFLAHYHLLESITGLDFDSLK